MCTAVYVEKPPAGDINCAKMHWETSTPGSTGAEARFMKLNSTGKAESCACKLFSTGKAKNRTYTLFLKDKIKGRACTLVCTLYSTGKAQKKQIGLN